MALKFSGKVTVRMAAKADIRAFGYASVSRSAEPTRVEPVVTTSSTNTIDLGSVISFWTSRESYCSTTLGLVPLVLVAAFCRGYFRSRQTETSIPKPLLHIAVAIRNGTQSESFDFKELL